MPFQKLNSTRSSVFFLLTLSFTVDYNVTFILYNRHTYVSRNESRRILPDMRSACCQSQFRHSHNTQGWNLRPLFIKFKMIELHTQFLSTCIRTLLSWMHINTRRILDKQYNARILRCAFA